MSLAITVSLYCGRLRRVEVPKKGGAGGLGWGAGLKVLLYVYESPPLFPEATWADASSLTPFFFFALSLSRPPSLS